MNIGLDSRRHFLPSLAVRLDALRATLRALVANRTGSVASIKRIARSFQGPSLVIGFPEIAERARELEKTPPESLVEATRAFLEFVTYVGAKQQGESRDVFLLVEDSPQNARMYKMILENTGRHILIAETAAQARNILNKGRIDLVLLDLMLPDADGRDFLLALKEEPVTASLPVIVISGRTNPQIQAECLALGAEAFLEKPVAGEVLSSTVSAVMEKIKLFRENVGTDPLTRLPNRSTFNNHFNLAKALTQRDGTPLSIAILDLDYFKEINDQYGHPAGDQALLHFVKVMESVLRRSDILSRWGGDEFVVLFPKTALLGARNALTKGRQALKASPLSVAPDVSITMSFSCGVVEVRADDDLESAVAEADKYLYVAKHAGRDRIVSPLDEITQPEHLILLVESDSSTRDMIEDQLAKENYKVQHFRNGKEALRFAQETPAELILLNMHLPDMDVLKWLQAIKEINSYADTPVALLAEVGDEKKVVHGFQLGADDYLLKPFTPAELVSRIRRLLQHH